MVVWIRLDAVVPPTMFSNVKEAIEQRQAEAAASKQQQPEETKRDDSNETPPPVDPGR